MATPGTYRLIYAGLGLLLVAIVAAAIALSGGGEVTPLPEPIEAIEPRPAASVLRQAEVVVDLPVGYALALEIDGTPIHPTEITFTEPTGVYVWKPGPGKSFEAWQPGEHEVGISWERTFGLPDIGQYRWTFRVDR